MQQGIDVSENNGILDWEAIWSYGIDFAIIRLGYGNGHLDSCFEANVNGALENGIRIGVYYYSYALNTEMAEAEAKFTLEVLKEYGLPPERLTMGTWFDMEDADYWKERHGMPSNQVLTDMCSKYICTMNESNYGCGIYASYDWLENRIYTDQLADYVPYWPAQWGSCCDWTKNTKMWQYTNELEIGNYVFDGNYSF